MLASLSRKPQRPECVAVVAKPFALIEEIGVKTGAFIQPPKGYSDRVRGDRHLSPDPWEKNS